MDYSPLNSAFYNINEVNLGETLNYNETHDVNYVNSNGTNYKNIHDQSRFGQTGNAENVIPGYTGGIQTHNYQETRQNEIQNQVEHFDVNNQKDGSYWNGQVIKNGINSNKSERFQSNHHDNYHNKGNYNQYCNCKHNTFLLYICIILLIMLYFKK